MTDKKVSKIPEFKSYQEEAEFWDTHDFTDFLDEFKPVEVVFDLPPRQSQGITVRFDEATLKQIRQRAARKGIGATTLIRMWVRERLYDRPSQGV